MRQTERQPDHTAHNTETQPTTQPAAAAHHHETTTTRNETGSSLGHTTPVWPPYSRDRSRVGGHKGECPVGTYSEPKPGSKKYGPKWQRTAIWGVFFFSGRTRPFIYTSGWSDQFRCQKSAPADLRSFRDFSGHHRAGQTKNSWVCVSSSSSSEQPQPTQTTSKQANAHEHKSMVHQARGARPPPRPVHECVGVCLPYVIARRSYF